jgi:hypothetical protein
MKLKLMMIFSLLQSVKTDCNGFWGKFIADAFKQLFKVVGNKGL